MLLWGVKTPAIFFPVAMRLICLKDIFTVAVALQLNVDVITDADSQVNSIQCPSLPYHSPTTPSFIYETTSRLQNS